MGFTDTNSLFCVTVFVGCQGPRKKIQIGLRLK